MLLCSGYRKSIDVILIPILISIDGSKFLICHNLIRQNRTTCIVYQYFKELFFECFSFRKADAKIETFRHYFQMFSEVFFIFLFSGHFRSERKKKKLEISILPITLTMSIIQPCFSCKSGAKVGHFTIRTKYMILFFQKK